MSNDLNFKFNNPVEITVRSGETGEIKEQVHVKNDTADSFACPDTRIYTRDKRNGRPYLALLPDDPPDVEPKRWDEFLSEYGQSYDPLKVTATFNNAWRKDPWAPYAYHTGRQGDLEAEPYWASHTWTMQHDKHRLFYRWIKLPGVMFHLRAMGLFGFDSTEDAMSGITGDEAAFFHLQTLLVLPRALKIKGRDKGNQVPDILEISYYISAVAVEE